MDTNKKHGSIARCRGRSGTGVPPVTTDIAKATNAVKPARSSLLARQNLSHLNRRRTLGCVPTRLAELRRLLRVDEHATFPLWLKVAVTLSYVFISRRTWQQYSAFNFLWFSHIGFMGAVLALWLESRLLASMILLNTFVADGVGWTLDLLVALVSGRHPFGATAYMFDQRIEMGPATRVLGVKHISPRANFFAKMKPQCATCWSIC